MCHMQGDGKIWNVRVESGVKHGDSKISVTKEIKTKMVRANYIQ